jgi:site-specific DNA recombinase
MKCAIYARYSSEKQSPASITDQVRKCREYAEKNGWQVLENHIYLDEAVTGATDDRAGLKRMLADATSRPRPFDCILLDDTSRLSRKLRDTLGINEQLNFAGVRIVFVSQGIDSESEQAGMLTAVHGMVDELYIRELGKKTFRGVEGLAKRKLHTGGRCFGYRNVPIEHESERDSHGRPVISGVRLEVDPKQAKTVQRIFSMYAEGRSLKFIAKKLNQEGVSSPQPQKGRVSRGWCPSSVRTILHNERYSGLVVWGKTKKVRSPRTGKRVYRPRPKSEWVKNEISEQRIISDELWQRVEERRELVHRIYSDATRKNGLMHTRALNSAYLFSGILKCADCGANLTVLWGKGRNKSTQVYGCPSNWNRGETVCKNTARIRRDDLESALLKGLQEKIMKEEVIDYVLERFEAGLLRELHGLQNKMERMNGRKLELEKEIHNLTQALAQGQLSPSIMAAIAQREKEISDITEHVVSSNEESIKNRVGRMRVEAKAKLKDLRGLLGRDVTVARAALLKHVEKIEMEPSGKTYVAKGNWDFFGMQPRDGAGGQNRTGYARLFRAALYQ